MRNGESGQLRGQRVREVVGELQFVRKLHFPLSSSSSPPGCTLYLTNPPIHPFQLVSLLVSWPDWHLPDCYVMFYICLLVGLDWSTTWTTLVFLPAAETRPRLHDWYDTRLSSPVVMSPDLTRHLGIEPPVTDTWRPWQLAPPATCPP